MVKAAHPVGGGDGGGPGWGVGLAGDIAEGVDPAVAGLAEQGEGFEALEFRDFG